MVIGIKKIQRNPIILTVTRRQGRQHSCVLRPADLCSEGEDGGCRPCTARGFPCTAREFPCTARGFPCNVEWTKTLVTSVKEVVFIGVILLLIC